MFGGILRYSSQRVLPCWTSPTMLVWFVFVKRGQGMSQNLWTEEREKPPPPKRREEKERRDGRKEKESHFGECFWKCMVILGVTGIQKYHS